MAWVFVKIVSMLLTALLLSNCVQVVITESRRLDNDLASTSQKTPKNCTTPNPVSGAMLKWRADHAKGVFKPGDKVEFVCKEGYRQIGWLESLTCLADGKWSSRSSIEDDFKSSEDASGYCVTSDCNGTEVFNCTSNRMPVDICKRCDCAIDCQDGSDEMGCGPILINVTERATGELKYPDHTNLSPYTGQLKCSMTLLTDEAGFYIKLLFTKFSFPEDCDENYLFLENATFTATPDCCKKSEKMSCGFGAKSGRPPFSHSAKSFMTITVVTRLPTTAAFTAKWYSVNELFPFGVVPKKDEPYPVSFKIPTAKSDKVKEEADTTYVAAVVLFSVFAFVVVMILACKGGRHFIGPQCSLGYCCAWVKARRNRRSSRATSPEATPIRTQACERGRIRGINGGPSSTSSSYGAAESVA